MTRKLAIPPAADNPPPAGRWRLQDARARLGEVVRRAHSDGPQHITVHGRDAVVILDAEEFIRLQRQQTGQALIDALQASPHREVELDLPREAGAMPVRDIEL